MFDWDEANINHIARHKVEPDEAEDAYLDENAKPAPAYNQGREERRAIIGKTYGGRILFMVYTYRGDLVCILSARSADSSEKRKYLQ